MYYQTLLKFNIENCSILINCNLSIHFRSYILKYVKFYTKNHRSNFFYFNNIIPPCVDFNSVYIPTRENTFYEEYTWIHDPLHLLFLSKRLIFRN